MQVVTCVAVDNKNRKLGPKVQIRKLALQVSLRLQHKAVYKALEWSHSSIGH